MARRSRRSRVFVSQKVRDANVVSIPRDAVSVRYQYHVPRYKPFRSLAAVFPYKEVEDNRLWKPNYGIDRSTSRLRSGYLLSGLPAAVGVSPSRSTRGNSRFLSFPSHRLAFAASRKVITCIRRTMRRQVLFARGVGGSGRTTRHPRWNELSNVSCRRS